MALSIRPVTTAADRRAFVALQFSLYADDPHWVAPLKQDATALISGAKSNPWFLHAEAAFWLAERDGVVVGRISAQVDQLVLTHMGAGTGHWGMFECIDVQAVADLLLSTAENWLRDRGMVRAQGPFSLSIWDEPGVLVSGFDGPPTVMMAHHRAWLAPLIERAGYAGIKELHTWEVDTVPFPAAVQRIVGAAAKASRIRIREVVKADFANEAALILDILNDAWATNWGYVPLTDAEVAFVGKKLKPIVYPDLIRIAEYDGVPVAFMIALPDLNEKLRDLHGDLFPSGWAKLLWRLRKPKVKRIRVPLMGVRKAFQGTRNASLMAFLLIELIREATVRNYGATRAEIGWILEDNGPMRSIAEIIGAEITRTYRVYEKAL
ncbi:N-acetyltransferase [Glacieibacterium frigidum]|uniref:N-acetyltransferase n=1 Tax=Glacieibacterium frigidum TaxID=2593303 RepID=A0A552U9T3_9SPHN|nr:N-acetyltransferase [Glacieibacterium frigidum]TRW14968.1 N-acetyltransferase [Glacieibacterium frigidum]